MGSPIGFYIRGLIRIGFGGFLSKASFYKGYCKGLGFKPL